MPLYEYQCDSCGQRFEVIQKFSDPPVETCRACGGPVKKLLSSPAIQFKGSGWYVTDYARKTGEAGAASSDAAKPAASSGESKPPATSSTSGSGDSPASTSSSSERTAKTP